MLGRPLLVEGEAGCGKTKLASSIAHELGLAETLVSLSIKSTSQAKDLLYRFDALRRLQDTQLQNDPQATTRARYIYPYINLQPLGEVIRRGEPAVVLIDEIDKADIDFPNDLLDVLGEFSFTIEELPAEESELSLKDKGFGRVVTNRAGTRPVVVVTSNREKQLPEAFLRRCLYVNLLFPTDDALLERIVFKNLDTTGVSLSQELVGAAVKVFRSIRTKAADQAIHKAPATGELVDWIRILGWKNVSIADLERAGHLPPFWRTLFKTMQDLIAYEAADSLE
jgi:MoxR-like ATPase